MVSPHRLIVEDDLGVRLVTNQIQREERRQESGRHSNYRYAALAETTDFRLKAFGSVIDGQPVIGI